MKDSSSSTKEAGPDQGRRGFLRRSGQGSLLAGAAVLGASTSGTSDTSRLPASQDGSTASTYHETDHIRKYYASSRIF